MARQVVHQLIDDLDNQLLEEGAGETVLFGLDSVTYEIDLSHANARALREAMAPYVASARKISARRGAPAGRSGAK